MASASTTGMASRSEQKKDEIQMTRQNLCQTNAERRPKLETRRCFPASATVDRIGPTTSLALFSLWRFGDADLAISQLEHVPLL
jgi:hypothetical protein